MLQQFRALLLWLPLLFVSWPLSAAPQVLTFGIVPQQAPSKLASLWGPMLKELSQLAEVELKFATAPNIPEFERRLAKGEYDIAYMNPYHFTVFNRAPGYHAIAKARNKSIKGIVVVRKDSPIADLDQIEGAQVAFPAPAAFAATLLSQSHLNNAGINYQPKYVSSHDSVYMTVARGLYLAGGGIQRTLNSTDPEVRKQLRVIWTSDGFTPHAIAVHPRIPQTQANSIQQALQALDKSVSGRGYLQGLSIEGWEPAIDQDWDDVRRLNIRKISN